MEFSSEKEIKELKYIGSGVVGATYLKDDIIIKKYHKIIRNCAGIRGLKANNPCLRYRKKQVNLLILRNEFIKYTNLINDVVFVNGKFVGVSYEYINGLILDEFIGKNISVKSNISYQLIRNAKELTDFCIYPLDYKPDNILFDNDGNVRIIDLDDTLTKVTFMRNHLYLYCSLYSLRRAVINFLENDRVYNYFGYYDETLYLSRHQHASELRKRKLISYKILRDYVALKCQSFDCSFLDCTNVEDISSIDFSFLKRIQEFTFTKFILCLYAKNIYSHSFYEYKKSIVQYFQEHSLDIYDLVVVSDETFENAVNAYLERNNILHSIAFRCPNGQDKIDVNFYVNFFNQSDDKNKEFIKK